MRGGRSPGDAEVAFLGSRTNYFELIIAPHAIILYLRGLFVVAFMAAPLFPVPAKLATSWHAAIELESRTSNQKNARLSRARTRHHAPKVRDRTSNFTNLHQTTFRPHLSRKFSSSATPGNRPPIGDHRRAAKKVAAAAGSTGRGPFAKAELAHTGKFLWVLGMPQSLQLEEYCFTAPAEPSPRSAHFVQKPDHLTGRDRLAIPNLRPNRLWNSFGNYQRATVGHGHLRVSKVA